MEAREILREFYPDSEGELVVEGTPVSDLAARFGTPLFVYSGAVMDEKLRRLREAFPDRFRIFYSVKANPAQEILRFFLERGCGLEVASLGEYRRARAAGCPPEEIFFAGPGKTRAELEAVIREGIGEIHAESPTEIRRIRDICSQLELEGNVSVRVNPSPDVQGGAMRMGGIPSPFGVDEADLDPVVDQILAAPCLSFSGIHLYTGTQILDAEVLLGQYRHGLELLRRVQTRLGEPLSTLDLGGGLGVPYYGNEAPLELGALRRGLEELLDEFQDDLAHTRLVVEPGRFLVAEAGIYVSRVTDVKISQGRKFVILDGGMHHHLAASGNLGKVIKRNFPLVVADRIAEVEEVEEVEVTGPLCTPLDVLGRSVSLPSPRPGDLIAILQSGAYARTASPLEFLSHPEPAEILVTGSKATPIEAFNIAPDPG